MSDNHAKDIVEAVEASDVYTLAIGSVPDDQKASVKATLDEFANVLAPMIKAVEQLGSSDDVADAFRQLLSEKLRGG